METTFNFIENNLFTYGNNAIYFSVSHPPEILLARVDEILSKYIGDLKLVYTSGEEQTLKDFLTHNLTKEKRI